MVLATVLIAIIFAAIIYKRNFPILDVPCEKEKASRAEITLDIRDYNVSDKEPMTPSVNIPVAYLNRNYKEVRGKQVHVIASNAIEKNVGIRMLRKKGIEVVSYSLTGCGCSNRKSV